MKRSRFTLPPKEYKKLVMLIMGRDNWRCKHCKSREGLHAHHIIYRSHGGGDCSWNLVTLCTWCHDAVHNRHLLILCATGELNMPINADVGVVTVALNGWKPRRRK